MKVSIYRLSRFADEEKHIVTWRQYIEKYINRGNWIEVPFVMDIPDRFNPHENITGDVEIEIGGKEYLLGDVLGFNNLGEPAIVWYDEDLKCQRSFSPAVQRVE